VYWLALEMEGQVLVLGRLLLNVYRLVEWPEYKVHHSPPH